MFMNEILVACFTPRIHKHLHKAFKPQTSRKWRVVGLQGCQTQYSGCPLSLYSLLPPPVQFVPGTVFNNSSAAVHEIFKQLWWPNYAWNVRSGPRPAFLMNVERYLYPSHIASTETHNMWTVRNSTNTWKAVTMRTSLYRSLPMGVA